MENNIENNITEDKVNIIQDFINQLKNRLEQECIYVIDRFENGFAICENRSTKQMVSIQKEKIPVEAKEGDILKFINNGYQLDYDKKDEIKRNIQEKMKNLFEE